MNILKLRGGTTEIANVLKQSEVSSIYGRQFFFICGLVKILKLLGGVTRIAKYTEPIRI